MAETATNLPIEGPSERPSYSTNGGFSANCPSVSVVIPALNEAENIARAVSSAVAAFALEVIVSDGGSHDETPAIAAAAGARLVTSRPGRGNQQNAGAEQATGDFILFLHADNWLSSDSIRQLADHAGQGAICGAFRQRIAAPGWKFRVLEAGNSARVKFFGLPYGDQAIFVKRSVFESVGGFPQTPLMEDVLLMRKLRKVAWPVLLPGPVDVDARRWLQFGVVRQTARNLCLLTALQFGASPDWLAKFYRQHS